MTLTISTWFNVDGKHGDSGLMLQAVRRDECVWIRCIVHDVRDERYGTRWQD